MNKILFLVDDDRIVRMYYHEKLCRQGLEVVTSSDMKGLFEQVDRQKPDIIVMDMKRWERLSIYPTFQYESMPVAPGYYMAKPYDSNGLKLQVEVALEGDVEFLNLILRKERRGTGVQPLPVNEDNRAVSVPVPGPEQWQAPAWNFAQNHS